MYRIPDQRRVVVSTAIVWLLIIFLGACALKIDNLMVPSVVQLNANDTLITLDCDYSYDEKEKVGLVVKWYREHGSQNNKTSQQVYQWIVDHPPQGLGILKDRINTSYQATEDRYAKYRALQIIKPSLNLSGEYKCHVSSNFHDAEKSQPMLIYSPARRLWMNTFDMPENMLNVTCEAEGLFPEPTAELRITKGNKKTKNAVLNAMKVISSSEEGVYNIIVHKAFTKKHLSAETIFDCIVSVPNTEYSAYKSLTYHRQDSQDQDEIMESISESDHAESELNNLNNNEKTNRTPESPRNAPSVNDDDNGAATPTAMVSQLLPYLTWFFHFSLWRLLV